MIERGIGYWITAEGELVPVPPRVSHADVVRTVTDPNTLDEDQREALLIDANAFVIARGWSRVRIYPGQAVAYLDYGVGQRDAHDRLMRDLLEQLDLADVAVKFTDEDGNYVSP
ncbi:MAG: hypothetical protein AAF710_02755 [Planctomycetota bacterium]